MTEQIELFSIESPCVGVCESNKRGYCFGCLRSRKERQMWLQLSDEQRRAIIRLLVARRKRVETLRLKRREQLWLDFGEEGLTGDLFV